MIKSFILATVLLHSAYAYAGGAHTDGHGSKNDQEMGHWQAPESARQQLSPIPADKTSINTGKRIYIDLCARCHGVDLQGDGPDAPALKTSPTNLSKMSGNHSDGDFAWKIKTGKGEMPAWEDDLEEKEIWSLVNYIQSFKKPEPHGQDKHDH